MEAAPAVVQVRPIGPSDAALVRDLVGRVRAEQLAMGGPNDPMGAMIVASQVDIQWRSYRAHFPDGDYQVIERDGEPVGAVFVARAPGLLHLVDIVVSADHRNRGVGGTVVQMVRDEARRSGLPLRLTVRPGNPAQRLYERLGARVVSESLMEVEMEWPAVPVS